MTLVWKGRCSHCRAETVVTSREGTDRPTRVYGIPCPNCGHEMELALKVGK